MCTLISVAERLPVSNSELHRDVMRYNKLHHDLITHCAISDKALARSLAYKVWQVETLVLDSLGYTQK